MSASTSGSDWSSLAAATPEWPAADRPVARAERGGAGLVGGRYRLEALPASRTSSGATWLAVDTEAIGQPEVAVKVFELEFAARLGPPHLLSERLHELRGREFEYLPTLLDFGWEGGHLFAVFDWHDGELIDQWITSDAQRTTSRRKGAYSLARALQELHELGFLHLALTPASVALDRADGSARLLDWGHMMQVSEEGQTTSFPGLMLEAAPYMSAELLSGGFADRSDDVYALACVIYELLSGTHPFGRRTASDVAVLGLRAAPLPELDERQNLRLSQALAPRRRDRASSLEHLVEALAAREPRRPIAALHGLSSRVTTEHARRAVIGLAILGVAAVGAYGVWSLASYHFSVVSRIATQVPVAAPAGKSGAVQPPSDRTAAGKSQKPAAIKGDGNDAKNLADALNRAVIAPGRATAPRIAPAAESPVAGAQSSEPVAGASNPSGITIFPPDRAAEPRGAELPRRSPEPGPSAAPEQKTVEVVERSIMAGRTPESAGRAPEIVSATRLTVDESRAPAQASPRGGACVNCDCASLATKRSFTSEPMRREELEFLRVHCR